MTRRWQNKPLTRERDHERMRGLWVFLLGLAIALTPFAVYLLQQMRYVETGYLIQDRRDTLQHLEERERRLRLERATLEALPRVERRATGELGLRPPEKVVVLPPHDGGQASWMAAGASPGTTD